MACNAVSRAVALSLGLIGCGAIANVAWRSGLWGSFIGAILAAAWLSAIIWWEMARRRQTPTSTREEFRETAADHLLLDAAPTPMLAIERDRVRVLNRAARRTFGTDDCILPTPAALLDPDAIHLRYGGHVWRIDRVILGAPQMGRSVAALIDVEQEERAAEARATAEMIHVLGHELMNGLAPIVSLAESGEAALDRLDTDPGLIREILGTLARRADGLQRFTEAYRELARLPPPRPAPVSVSQIVDDLARLFRGRWNGVELFVDAENGPAWPLDRDQIGQALWALLQNAGEAAIDGICSPPRVHFNITYTDTALVVVIQDSGRGVAVEDAVRIFRPFNTSKSDGTGIGLSLARQIARGHGGEVSFVMNEVTTFVLSLPWREL